MSADPRGWLQEAVEQVRRDGVPPPTPEDAPQSFAFLGECIDRRDAEQHREAADPAA